MGVRDGWSDKASIIVGNAATLLISYDGGGGFLRNFDKYNGRQVFKTGMALALLTRAVLDSVLSSARAAN